MIDDTAAFLSGASSARERFLDELARGGEGAVELERLRQTIAASTAAARALAPSLDWKPPPGSAAAAHRLGAGAGDLWASVHHLERARNRRAAEIAERAEKELAATQSDERASRAVKQGAVDLLALLKRSDETPDRRALVAEVDAGVRTVETHILLAEIVHHPDAAEYRLDRDHQLRLAYATLLEAQDHARAELIRVQIELSHARAAGQPAPPRLVTRERDLLGKHGRGWAAVTDLVAAYRFARGFVVEITLSAGQLLDRWQRLYSLAPITQLVIRGGTRDELEAIFRSPALARIRGLDVSGQAIGDGGVARLAASPYAERLTMLNLTDNRLTYSGLRSLAESPHLGALAVAELAGNIDDPAAVSSAPGEWELPPVGRQLEEEHGARIRWLHRYELPPGDELDVELLSLS